MKYPKTMIVFSFVTIFNSSNVLGSSENQKVLKDKSNIFTEIKEKPDSLKNINNDAIKVKKDTEIALNQKNIYFKTQENKIYEYDEEFNKTNHTPNDQTDYLFYKNSKPQENVVKYQNTLISNNKENEFYEDSHSFNISNTSLTNENNFQDLLSGFGIPNIKTFLPFNEISPSLFTNIKDMKENFNEGNLDEFIILNDNNDTKLNEEENETKIIPEIRKLKRGLAFEKSEEEEEKKEDEEEEIVPNKWYCLPDEDENSEISNFLNSSEPLLLEKNKNFQTCNSLSYDSSDSESYENLIEFNPYQFSNLNYSSEFLNNDNYYDEDYEKCNFEPNLKLGGSPSYKDDDDNYDDQFNFDDEYENRMHDSNSYLNESHRTKNSTSIGNSNDSLFTFRCENSPMHCSNNSNSKRKTFTDNESFSFERNNSLEEGKRTNSSESDFKCNACDKSKVENNKENGEKKEIGDCKEKSENNDNLKEENSSKKDKSGDGTKFFPILFLFASFFILMGLLLMICFSVLKMIDK